MAIAEPTVKLIIKVVEILANIFIALKPDKTQSKGGNKK